MHMSMAFFLGRKPNAGEHSRDVSGLYQAVGYMRSFDFGRTWQKDDGTPVPLPATSDTLDLLEEGESNNPKPALSTAAWPSIRRTDPTSATFATHPRPVVPS